MKTNRSSYQAQQDIARGLMNKRHDIEKSKDIKVTTALGLSVLVMVILVLSPHVGEWLRSLY